MSSPSPKVAELATHEGSTALIGHDQGHARPGAINNGRAWLATLRRRYFFMGHGYLSSLVRSLKSADLVTQRLAEQEWNNFQQSQASRDPPRAIHIDTITLSDRKDFQLWRAKVLEELSPKIIDKAVGDTWREKWLKSQKTMREQRVQIARLQAKLRTARRFAHSLERTLEDPKDSVSSDSG